MCEGLVPCVKATFVISVNLVPSDPRHQFENPMLMHVTIQAAVLKGGLCRVFENVRKCLENAARARCRDKKHPHRIILWIYELSSTEILGSSSLAF